MTETEPLVGDTLISIILGPWQIDFDFANTLLQVSGSFLFRRKDGSASDFSPALKQGDVSQLWSLIEQDISAVRWQDEIVIIFQTGDEIVILPGFPRGTISSKTHANRVEDF
jgi:hypothetical protein